MRNRFVRTALVRETALRLASEALADLDFTPSDLDPADRLTAEEHVAIFREIRSIADRLLLDAEELGKRG